jgi:tetratricopeptide (TPR) repeat protein
MICTFINGILKKIEPSYYQQKLEEGRVYYYQNKSIEALETLKTTKSLHQNPYESCSLIAQIYKDKNEITTAINSYEESISFNQFYFKALKRLSDLYYQQKNFKKSYEITQAMTSHYPISPERIPDLIRLSIINKKYEDIINYFKIFKTIQSPNLEMQQFLSAAMAILGKYFTQTNDTPRAIEALQAAYKFSNGKYEILKSVTQSFQELNKVEILLEMFDKTDLSKWSLEVQGLYFLTLHLTSQDDQHIILVGEKMLKNQVVDFNIYKGVIERSIKIKRSKSNILILISEAIKYFPEHALEFENLKDTLST